MLLELPEGLISDWILARANTAVSYVDRSWGSAEMFVHGYCAAGTVGIANSWGGVAVMSSLMK